VHNLKGMFLIGVFLDDQEPAGAAPARVDFSNDSFTSFSPILSQTFFIGDGLTGTGVGDVQTFNVPAGATRLFLGFADAFNFQGPAGTYVDNGGTLQVTVTATPAPEPSSSVLALLGVGVAALRRRRMAIVGLTNRGISVSGVMALVAGFFAAMLPCKAALIYVSDGDELRNVASRVVGFDASGTATVFADTGLDNPIGLAFDASGNLYVANSGHSNATGTITKFTPGGVGTQFANTLLDFPTGLAFDGSGNLFAVNSRIGTIAKFTPGGVGSIFAQDPGDQSLLWASYGAAFDSTGNLYVTNFFLGNIVKFTPGGGSSVFATGLSNPEGLAFDSEGNLFVANFGSSTITKFTAGGVGSIFASGGVSNPAGIAFDEADNLYVVNQGNRTVSKFTPDGVGSVFADTGLNYPTFIVVAVPKPTGIVLALLGVGVAALRRRRFRVAWRTAVFAESAASGQAKRAACASRG